MITVIIPCKDQINELKNCLAAFERFEEKYPPFEIVVINSANDSRVSAALSDYPKVINLATERILEPGPARNLGSQRAGGEILAFIDADCVPQPDWIERISKAFQGEIVMVGGSIVTENYLNPLALSDNIIQFCQLSSRRPAGEIRGLAGCNLSIRKDVFEEVGGFPDIRVSEDWSLSKKVSKMWPSASIFIPEIKVAHIGRSTFRAYFSHQFFHGYQRGLLGLDITPWQQTFGKSLFLIPFVITKRFVFIYSKIIRWEKWRSILYLLLAPTVIYGLLAWAWGFRMGCKEADNET